MRKILETRNNQEMKMLRKIGIVTVGYLLLCSPHFVNISSGMQCGFMGWYSFSCRI